MLSYQNVCHELNYDEGCILKTVLIIEIADQTCTCVELVKQKTSLKSIHTEITIKDVKNHDMFYKEMRFFAISIIL
jgi:hypothetical protein